MELELADGEVVLGVDDDVELGVDDDEEPLAPWSDEDDPIELWLDCEDDPLAPDCDAPPWTPNAESVCESSWPVCGMFCCCWKLFSAPSVFGPIWPSIGPTSRPLSFRAFCASRTVELSADWAEDEGSDDDGLDCWLDVALDDGLDCWLAWELWPPPELGVDDVDEDDGLPAASATDEIE